MRQHPLAVLALAVCMLLGAVAAPAPTACAETKVVEADGVYLMGDHADESFGTARERAKEDAMRRASDRAGIYIESYSKTVDCVLTEDEVRMLTSKVLEVQDVSYRNDDMAGRGLAIHCHIRAKVETVKVDDFIREMRAKTKEMEQKNQDLTQQTTQLQAEQEQLRLDVTTAANLPAIEERLRWKPFRAEEQAALLAPKGVIRQVLVQKPESRIAIAALAYWSGDAARAYQDIFQAFWTKCPEEPLAWYGMYLCTKDQAMLAGAVQRIHRAYRERDFYRIITYTVTIDGRLVHGGAGDVDVCAVEIGRCMADAFGIERKQFSYPEGREIVVTVPRYNETLSRDPFEWYYGGAVQREVLWQRYKSK